MVKRKIWQGTISVGGEVKEVGVTSGSVAQALRILQGAGFAVTAQSFSRFLRKDGDVELSRKLANVDYCFLEAERPATVGTVRASSARSGIS